MAAGTLALLIVLLSVGDHTQAQPSDSIPPTLLRAETDTSGIDIILTFSEDIIPSPVVFLASELFNSQPSDFIRAIMNVTIDGHRDLLVRAEVSGPRITYRITEPAIRTGQMVRISYNNVFAMNYPGLVVDRAGNPLAFFDEQVVQNHSTVTAGTPTRQGPTVSNDAITLTEGETATYTVQLPSQPAGEVTVNVEAIPMVIEVRPSRLTFDENDWDEPKTVTLTSYRDRDSFDAWAIVGHTYSDLAIGRSSTFARVVVEDANPSLVVTGNTAVQHVENSPAPLATYSVTGGGTSAVSWRVYGPDKARFSVSSAGILSFVSPPDFEQPADSDGDNIYVVVVLASDGSSTGFAVVTVVVTDMAEPPRYPDRSTTRMVAENSAPGTDVGDPVAAIDDAGDTPTYTLTGTDAGSFDIVSTTGQIRTRSGVTYDHETKSSYSLTVNVSDGVDSSGDPDTSIDDSIAVAITVTDVNEPPAFATSETGARSVQENSRAGVNVGDAVVATDQDRGTALSYTLTGTDANQFEIVGATGQIRTKSGVTYDHETDASYSVTVNVIDGKDADGNTENPPVTDASIPVTITIDDVDEKPELTGPVSATYPENDSDVVARYSARDPEGATITWSLSGSDHALFEIDSAGAVEFVSPPDFEASRGAVYRLTVEASDSDVAPRLTARRNLVVTVTDENEPPVITSNVPGALSHDENRTGAVAGARFTANDPDAGDTIRWSLSGSDRAAFTIRSGTLAFDSTKPAPDHEAQDTYTVTVEASSGPDTVRQSVTVMINDVEEAGSLGLPLQPQVDASYAATFTEGDDVASESWQWARSTSRSGGWNDITGATGSSYTPVEGDVNHYLRATIEYDDPHGQKDLEAVSRNRVQAREGDNTPPTFPSSTETRSVDENARAGANVGDAVTATDIDAGDVLNYELSGSSLFTIRPGGQIRVAQGAVLDYEAPGGDSHTVTVTATDPSGDSSSVAVTIEVRDVNEAAVAEDHVVTTSEDTATDPITVLFNDSDPDEDDTPDTLTALPHGRPRNGSVTLNADKTLTYTPADDYSGRDSFTYRIRDDGNLLSNIATVTVAIVPVNDPPTFPAGPLMRTVGSGAVAGANVGAPVTAADVDREPLEYSLSGGSGAFEIDQHTGQIQVTGNVPLDTASPYMVTVRADDTGGGVTDVEVIITVTARPVSRPASFVGGGAAPPAPSGPTPSEVDFKWTVEHDIEALDEGHDSPTGAWSDGTTLWVADNPDGAGDGIYAYDLESGERIKDRELELDPANRAPRGVWSDRATMWVSDSGQDRLFAYDMESGERLEEREFELAGRNHDPRGIWSDGVTLWVLDDRRTALFAYDLASGALLAEYALDPSNSQPHGIWSDGLTVWVSNHDPKRLFAYRVTVPAEDEGADDLALERVPAEEFEELGRVSNNSPRGIWSDGAVMYVADANDDKVYSYKMPDATDARLKALGIEGVDIGEFSPLRRDYASETIPHGNIATLTATPAQDRASVQVDPPDHDGDPANGRQLRLLPGLEITVTVTSPDGSRVRVYRVVLGDEEGYGGTGGCLRGAVDIGFSLVVFEGGSVEDLVACAEARHVTALYALSAGEYVSYIVGAPDFVNERFAALYADGVSAHTPLIVSSAGPATEAPVAAAATEPPGMCLQGELTEGFSLVVYEGGSVDDLVACAEGLGIASLYVLSDGAWSSYILSAPDFVNRDFHELFRDGVPAATPLVARRD